MRRHSVLQGDCADGAGLFVLRLQGHRGQTRYATTLEIHAVLPPSYHHQLFYGLNLYYHYFFSLSLFSVPRRIDLGQGEANLVESADDRRFASRSAQGARGERREKNENRMNIATVFCPLSFSFCLIFIFIFLFSWLRSHPTFSYFPLYLLLFSRSSFPFPSPILFFSFCWFLSHLFSLSCLFSPSPPPPAPV